MVFSGFSGTRLQSARLAPNVDPLTKTVLDPDGPTLEVLNGIKLGALAGQTLLSPSRLSFKARDIGHVFALAFDNGPAAAAPEPSLFAGATSAFGLHIVGPDTDGDGEPDRLDKGAAGATFMEGQFGTLPGAGPGTIWKIDRRTGTPSLFAEIINGGVKNSGPGIGGLAFDAQSRTLYASDLDTGLIHRFSIADATDKGQFDYGVAARPSREQRTAVKDDGKRLDITKPEFVATDPKTWGYTKKERRIDALAVHDGRLYFAVAEGPEIWSVGLEADGAFKTDARFELALTDQPPFPVTGLAFDQSGRMILAQRGDVQNPADFSAFTATGPARVLRFATESPDDPATPGTWKLPGEEYAIGTGENSRSSAGGVALQYSVNADGTLDTTTCSGTLAVTGSTLGTDKAVQGLQLSAAGIVRPANVPPEQSAVIAWMPNLIDAQARGYVGGVAVLHSCAGDTGVGFPELAGGEGFPGLADGGVGGGLADGGLAGGGGAVTDLPLTDGGAGGGVVTDPPVADGGGGGKVQIGPLSIEKTAVSTSCNETDPCTFDIRVTNTSGAALPGPITIQDLFSVGEAPLPGAKLSGTPSEPWTCATSAAPGLSCTHPGPLQPNVPETLTLSFIPGPLGAATEVKNCVTTAGAPAPAPQQQGAAPSEALGMRVLTTALTPSCASGAPCTFQVTGTNISGKPLTGQLFVMFMGAAPFTGGTQGDRLASEIIASTPPPGGTCNAEGNCTVPQFTLAPGAEVTATFTVKITAPVGVTFDSFGGLGGVQIPGALQPPENGNSDAGTTAFGFARRVDAGDIPPAPQPIAPGKKSQAPPREKSLLRFATFTPPAMEQTPWPLLHRLGGGGNIGGVGALRQSPCTKFLRDGFSVQQSNGFSVSFLELTQRKSNLSGTAKHGNVKGKVTGTIGPSSFNIVVDWADGSRGNYKGTMAPGGGVTGTTTDSAGNRASFKNIAPLVCVEDEACVQYAQDAALRAKVFASEKCGAPPEGRWSQNEKDHLQFCMASPPNASILTDENNARANELKACQDAKATNTLRCEEFAKNGVSQGQEFTALKCTNARPGVLSENLEEQKGFCLANPTDQFIASAQQARDEHLALCRKLLAGTPGGAPGGGVPGGGPSPAPGQVPPAGPGQPPAPQGTSPPLQACAIVPVAPKVTGDPVPQGNGLTLLKEPVTADCSGPTGCEFKITLKNEGAQPTGAVTIVDTPTGDGDFQVVSDALAVSPPAPWVCEKGTPKKCTHPGPIAPGATETFNIGLSLSGPNQTATAMRNCVLIQPPADAAAPPPACADMKVKPAPSQAGPLTLVKTGGACRDNRLCDFTIAVRNSSAQPFNGTVEFDDTITGDDAIFGATAITPAPPAPWSCPKTGQSFKCTANLSIPANGAAPPLKLTFDLGAGIGAVKNVKNCAALKDAAAPSCATIPLQGAPPAPPPAGAKTLVLAKNPVAEKCSDTGGGCDFVVSITNTGDTDFTGPIAFTDLVSTADGTPLPNADFGNVQVTGAGGPDISAPFVCTKGGGGLTCATGALKVKIPPKRTLTFPMSIKPGPTGGATAVKNCAQMQLDNFAEPVCRTIPLVDGPLLRATKLTASTTCNPECFFSVSIRNVGNADAIGPFAFTDRFTPNSKIIAISAKSGDFTCRLDTGQGNGIAVCSGNKQRLAPGEQLIGSIAVQAVPLAAEYTNCAEIVQSGAPVDIAAPNKCVTIKEPRPNRADLAVTKVATDNAKNAGKLGECRISGPCNYKINVFNNGNAPYNGPITVVDDVPEVTHFGKSQPSPTGIETRVDPNWTCTKTTGRSLACTHKLTTLAPGAGVLLDVVITPGPSWKKNDLVNNCARIVTPVGNDAGDNRVNDADCADVQLDPFSVNVSKTGDQLCPPGSNCTFKISLSNPGPIDHNAPVTITDKLSGLSSAQIVSITPPLPCATQPTQIPFSCTSPGPVRLDLDAPAGSEFGPKDFVMVVKLPNDATAEQFSNCATVGGDSGTSKQSCATVATKPTLPAGKCEGGMVMTARGCACPIPTKFDGKVCIGAGGINATPLQPEPQPEPTAPPPPVATQCRGGMIAIEGTCACPPATQWNGRQCAESTGFGGSNSVGPGEDKVRPLPANAGQCPADRPVGTFPDCCPRNSRLVGRACTCEPGFEVGRGACVPVRQTTPSPPPASTTGPASTPRPQRPQPPPVVKCPGDRPVGRPPNCCPQNSRQVGRECQCLPGFQAARGQCRPAPQCPPNARLVGNDCQCNPGFEMRRRVCRPVAKEQPKCPPNLPVGEFPKCCPLNAQFIGSRCECRPGFVNRRGQCRPAPTPQPQPQPDLNRRVCPDGTVVFGKFTKCPGGPTPRPAPTPAPTPVPTGPSPKPAPPRCTGGKVLTPDKSRCVCPARQEDNGKGQCVDKVF